MGRVVVSVALLLLLLGAGAGMYMATARGHRSASRHTYLSFVASGPRRAVQYEDGLEHPMRARGVEVRGATIASTWDWSGPTSVGSYPWEWTRRGALLVGELHPTTGSGPGSLVAFDAGRGWLTTVDDLESGAFAFADDHTVIASAPRGTLRLIDLASSPPATSWRTTVENGSFVTHVAATPRYAIAWNGALQVFDRANADTHRTLAPLTDLMGIATTRDEALVLRDGRMAVLSLADGSPRMTVDLGNGQPVSDGFDDPCLLGRHGDRWVVAYATDGVQSVSNHARQYSIPAPITIAAVEIATGNVAWRTAIGRWSVRCANEVFRNELANDDELTTPMLLHGIADVPAGGMQGHFATIDLESGAVVWDATYDRENPSGSFFTRIGSVVYLRTGDVDADATLRFDGGRLTGAARVRGLTSDFSGPAASADGLWVGGDGAGLFLAAPDLHVAAGEGDRSRVADARAWAVQRYALPAAAH